MQLIRELGVWKDSGDQVAPSGIERALKISSSGPRYMEFKEEIKSFVGRPCLIYQSRKDGDLWSTETWWKSASVIFLCLYAFSIKITD